MKAEEPSDADEGQRLSVGQVRIDVGDDVVYLLLEESPRGPFSQTFKTLTLHVGPHASPRLGEHPGLVQEITARWLLEFTKAWEEAT